MMRSVVLLATVLAIFNGANGAVLVRFINTVPQRQTTILNNVNAGGRTVTEVYDDERIGLQYFAQTSSGSNLQSPTLVWTEPVNRRLDETGTTTDYAPYAFTHAMPALRGYHLSGTGVNAIDRIAAYKSIATQIGIGGVDIDASGIDNYEQTSLKTDGVGLYLSFAAGSYQVQAYATIGSTVTATAVSQLPRQLSGSLRQVDLTDGKVYSIIAIGDGKYSDSTSPTNGNTVKLVLIEESTAATTFGMASLRWFHGIKSQSASSVTVFKTDTTSGNQIAANIAFGAVSDYVDVAPGTSSVFFVTIAGTASQTVIAPSSASRVEVTHDVRAGLRATVFCAMNDETTASVFCRMIPSRVVAYVRLINDLAGQTSLVQGAFGSQPLSDTKLTLWASYEYPRPSQVVDQSQNIGNNNIPTISTTSRGLYGVVSSVASNTCSGYGEVWVPVLIMDFAVRFTIVRDHTADLPDNFAAATLSAYNSAAKNNQQDPVTANNDQWFWGAPIFKRVNFIVKTEGFSTLAGLGATQGNAVRADVDTHRWYTGAFLLDEYMEPGQYYSLVASAPTTPTPANPYVPNSIQLINVVEYSWRLDRSVDTVASGIQSGKSLINWIPIGRQNFFGTTVNLRQKGTTNVNLQLTPAATDTYRTIEAVAGATFSWNDPAATAVLGITADASTYTFDQALAAVTSSCTTRIPGSTDVTLAAGDIVDVMILNSFGCLINNNDLNRLQVTMCKTQSALVTGHAVNTLLAGAPAAGPSQPFFAGSASSASASIAMIVAALLAVLATLF